VKSLVEAHDAYPRETRLRLLDQLNGNCFVCRLFHDLMMEDESVLIFDHADRQSELDRNSRLSFANPLGRPLKNRKHLFPMGNRLSFQHSPINLTDLPDDVLHIPIKQFQEDFRYVLALLQAPTSLLRAGQMLLRFGQIRLIRGLDDFELRRLFIGILGSRAPELLYSAIELLELANQIAALSLGRQLRFLRQINTGLNGLSDRIQ
jgi:hypothetical protein